MTKTIGLVVPAFEAAGGLRTVAEFLIRTIRRRSDLDLRVISIPMSSVDDCSLVLRRPATWRRGATTRTGVSGDIPFVHAGGWLVDFEVQRLRPRAALSHALRDCDLIQVVAGTPAWALPAIGLGKPVVLQVATLITAERRRRAALERSAAGWWRRRMTEVVSRLDDEALAKVDAVLVENPWMHDYARRLSADVTYAPPGVDTKLFLPKQHRASERGHILSVGRLDDPRKNPTLLLEAYAAFAATSPSPAQLILAGASEPPVPFWARAQELGVRQLIRWIPRPSHSELIQLYQGAQSFALSSDEEGFGLVLVEAMACGVPVVSTRSGGPEGIISDGQDGFLVDIEDAAALADRLRRLATDATLNRRMGAAARNTAESRFSEAVTGQAYLDAYDRLLGLSPQGAGGSQCA
jgi:glycosyltransferase involved in cell wall biosynthesis